MGSSTRFPRWTAAQSTVRPAACRAARASSALRRSALPRCAGTQPSTSALSAASGPISSTCAASRRAAPSANRTVFRTLLTQYPASCGPASEATPTNATDGSARSADSTTDRNSVSTGSMCAEWKAWLTARRLTFTPRASYRAASSTTASSSPDTTTESGAFTAAISTPSTSSRSSSATATAAIAPRRSTDPMSAPRRTTSRAASASENTPATWAAAISPTEWPRTTSGRTPQDSNSRTSASSNAKMAGWANCVSSIRAPSVIASRTSAGNRARTSSKARANTGNASASSRPIPARCEPWPVNTNAVRPPRAGTTWPERSRSTSSSRVWPTAAIRCSSADRVVASECATSTAERSGMDSSRSAIRAACAWAPASPRPETTSATGPSQSDGATGSAAWPCSSTTCALVPLMPNDDTPARRGRSRSGHGVFSVVSLTAPPDQSTCGVGASTCRVAGTTPWRMAMIALSTPAAPAAACVWPRLDLTEPSSNGAGRSWP